MLKSICKIRVNQTIRARCERHPAYDPSTPGRDHITDRCATCRDIFDLHESKLILDRAVKNFERRAESWQAARKSGKSTTSPE